MPTPPVIFGETLAIAGLALLRTAIGNASVGDPLHGVYIPPIRFQEIPDGTLKALTLHFAGERGAGVSRSLPELELADSLHINGFVAQGREEATDLDTVTGQLIQAALDTLLEDESFLTPPAWIEGVNVEKHDATVAKDATRFDAVVFSIEIDIQGGHTFYTPSPPTAPLQIADVQMTWGDIMIEARNELPQ